MKFDFVLMELHHICRMGDKVYVRYDPDNWCIIEKHSKELIFDEELMKNLEKAFQNYHK